MERKIIIIVSSAQIISIIVAFMIVIIDEKTCFTDKCLHLADVINSHIDVEVSPCENFYDFACGKLLARDESERPEDLGFVNENLLREKRRVKRLLTEAAVSSDEPKSFRLVKSLYKSCLDGKLSKEAEASTLFKDVGGFPTLENDTWDEANWSFVDTSIKMRLKGFSTDTLFTLTGGINPLDSSKITLHTNNPTLNAAYELSHDCEECENMFVTKYVRIATSLNADENTAAADGKELYLLASRIMNNSLRHPNIDYFKPLDLKLHVKTISSLATTFGFIDWKEYIEGMLQKKVDPSSVFVVVANPGYLAELNLILGGISKRTLANYMIWMNIESLYSVTTDTKRSGTCFKLIKRHLLLIIQSMYVHSYDRFVGEAYLTRMFENIKRQAMSAISKVDWMSPVVKQIAEDKVKEICLYLGFLDELDVKTVDEHFENIQLTDSFLTSMLNVVKFRQDEVFQSIGQPADKKFWKIDGLNSDPLYDASETYYNYADNCMWVAPGILQPPVFDKYWPESVNYGRVGNLLGQEMTHAFDASGRGVDKDGVVGLWWDRPTSDRFKEKSRCFIDQYSNFTIKNIEDIFENLPGKAEVDYNIADATGVKTAFNAYRKYTDGRFLSEAKLPGVDYTSEQIFFISVAHLACNRYEEEQDSISIDDPFAPARYRVIGSLQNTPEFSEVFSCESGSRMNPDQKCEMW